MVFNRILLPLDGSVHAEHAIAHAGRVARLFGSHLSLLRVLDGIAANGRTGSESIDWRLQRAEAERYLSTIQVDPRLRNIESDVAVTEGKPADRIADHIRRNDIDLVIMSSWGAGGENEFPHGGTVFKVLVSTGTSYLVVNHVEGQGGSESYRRILVPLDGSHKAEAAAHVAVAMDAAHDADILFCHVVSEPAMPRRRPLTETERSLKERLIECNRRVAGGYLEELRDQFGGQHRIRTRLEVARDPVACITELCQQEKPDLMILTGAHGIDSNGWSRESILQTLLASAHLPILVIRGNQEASGNAVGIGQ
jgi:nucleotide-binding universal stress UspA family protein